MKRIDELAPYGNLIAVAGGLLLFFSWTITNIVGEQLTLAKTAFVDARSTRRLYEELRDIKSYVQGTAATVNNLHIDFLGSTLERDSEDDQDRALEDYATQASLLEIAAARFSTRQIDDGIAFCQLTLQESKTGKGDSDWVSSLEQLSQEMIGLQEEKERILKNAEDLYRRPLPPQEELEEIHKALSPLRELIDQFGPLIGKAVDAANGRIAELGLELERIEARAGKARGSAIGLYILGSILVLAGTALSKIA